MKVIIMIVGSVAILAFLYLCSQRHRNLKLIVRTERNLDDVVLGLKRYADDLQSKRVALHTNAFPLTAQTVYRALSENPSGEPSYLSGVPMLPNWTRAQRLTDAWNNEIFFRKEAVGNVSSNGTIFYRISIWSAGPNGHNNEGRADDIAVQPFIIELPKG